MEKVAFVILTYKNIVDTIECVQSIKGTLLDEFQKTIIVIDNSEVTSYLDEIKKDKSIYCYSVKNEGYSAGNNYGIKKAIEAGCEYIVVINNDTIVEKDFALPLLTFLKNNKKSIVAPVIMSYYDRTIWSSGGKYRCLLKDYKMLNNPIKRIRKTDFATGCCFATTKEVFDEIGYLKEEYFMYNEDAEFCHRANKNHISIFVLPDSVIFHKISASTAPNSPFQLYYIYRNRIIFAREEYSGLSKIYAVFINIIKAHYRYFSYKLKHKNKEAMAVLFAIKDSKASRGRYRY